LATAFLALEEWLRPPGQGPLEPLVRWLEQLAAEPSNDRPPAEVLEGLARLCWPKTTAPSPAPRRRGRGSLFERLARQLPLVGVLGGLVQQLRLTCRQPDLLGWLGTALPPPSELARDGALLDGLQGRLLDWARYAETTTRHEMPRPADALLYLEVPLELRQDPEALRQAADLVGGWRDGNGVPLAWPGIPEAAWLAVRAGLLSVHLDALVDARIEALHAREEHGSERL
jgi:hypothetical protein